MSENRHPEEIFSKGLLYCFLGVVFGVSLVGFLTGTSDHSEHLRPGRTLGPEQIPKGKVPLARSYREMRDTARGPGSRWRESVAVAAQSKGTSAEKISLEEALRKRRAGRAYDGAPPTIPHFIRQNSASECLACHADGLRLGERQASVMPHSRLTQCTQCHVSEFQDLTSRDIGSDPRDVPNSFVGMEPVRRGPRAWNIAPPQMPHSGFMRENCLSCHGPSGSSPMRSPHLQRQNCTQCHSPSAALDLRPGLVR